MVTWFSFTFTSQTLSMEPGVDSADTNCASPLTLTGRASGVAGLVAIAPVSATAPVPFTKSVTIDPGTAGFVQLFSEPSALSAIGWNAATIVPLQVAYSAPLVKALGSFRATANSRVPTTLPDGSWISSFTFVCPAIS